MMTPDTESRRKARFFMSAWASGAVNILCVGVTTWVYYVSLGHEHDLANDCSALVRMPSKEDRVSLREGTTRHTDPTPKSSHARSPQRPPASLDSTPDAAAVAGLPAEAFSAAP